MHEGDGGMESTGIAGGGGLPTLDGFKLVLANTPIT